MESDESFSEMLENEAPVGFGGGRNAGKRSTGAVLKAKMEIRKKYFVSTAGHSELQQKTFEKISSTFVRFVSRRRVFPKPAVARGNPYYFWVRNSVPWVERTLLLTRTGFCPAFKGCSRCSFCFFRRKFRQKKGGVLVAFVTPVQEFGGCMEEWSTFSCRGVFVQT